MTVQAIRALRSHGIDTKDIEKAIRKTARISEKKLNELFDDVIAKNRKYYTEVIDMAGLTQPETLVDAATIDAIRRQTLDEFHNITASMGFLVDNGRTMLPPAKAYQHSLDAAVMEIQSGAISYNEAIKRSIKELAESGLKTVSYESGHVDSVDTAIRRAVMTGVNQLNRKFSEQSMDFLQTDLVEVSAHSGARDIDGPKGFENHKRFQGKIYRWADYTEKYPDASKGDYPDFEASCGIGDVQGILGANCRHSWTAFVEGVMEPTYSDSKLEHIDDGKGCVFDGKEYTAYSASQMQRRLERQIKRQKQLKNAYEKSGLTEDARAANIKLRRLNTKYKDFSEAAGLPEQRERTKVLYIDAKAEAAASAAKAAEPIVRLQNTLGVESEIVNGIVPKGSEIGSIREIAGGDSGKQLRVAKFLSENYGGEPLQWRKMGGIIQTDNFQYDVHWVERNGERFEEKLKGVKKK